jgi:hypothetical protein
MNEQQLRTIENVTANFFFWQGLRWVPMGMALMIGVLAPRFLVVAMAAAFVVSMLAGKYYSRTYGRVRTIAARTERRQRWKWFYVYPMMLLSLIADMLWKPPLFVSGVVWAVAIILYWNSTGRGRLHYLVIAGLIAATTALPLAGVPNGRNAINFFFAVIGAAYVVGGLLDHFELTRIMGDGDAGTV